MNYNFNMSKIYMNKLEAKIKELEERIDKAIEYIKENYDNATYTYSKDKDIYCKCFDELLVILKGSDSNV